MDFMNCDELVDHKGNLTAKLATGYGCLKMGGQRYQDVEFTQIPCTALPGIECYGNRTFYKDRIPCIRYTDQFFLQTLLYSMFLGPLGIDRFCLGYVGAAVAKLLTLGGGGIWWLIDIILLIFGQLMPADDSNWIPFN